MGFSFFGGGQGGSTPAKVVLITQKSYLAAQTSFTITGLGFVNYQWVRMCFFIKAAAGGVINPVLEFNADTTNMSSYGYTLTAGGVGSTFTNAAGDNGFLVFTGADASTWVKCIIDMQPIDDSTHIRYAYVNCSFVSSGTTYYQSSIIKWVAAGDITSITIKDRSGSANLLDSGTGYSIYGGTV